MRKNRVTGKQNDFSILALDDDQIMTLTLQSYFQTSGFYVDIENDPEKAIERVRDGHYDILLLDFLMTPICGDEVVARIREFDSDIYIILLTGHKSMAPPIKTIRELDIQGYYEKSDRFDQLELLVESCAKSIRQMRTIYGYRDGLKQMVDALPQVYQSETPEGLMHEILAQAALILGLKDAVIYLDDATMRALYHDAWSNAGARCFFGYEGNADGEEWAKNAFAAICGQAGAEQRCAYIEEGAVIPLLGVKNVPFGLLAGKMSSDQQDKQRLMEVFAQQAAAAISNVLLMYLVKTQNNELKSAYAKMRDSYMEVISALRLVVDAKDIYTRGHSDRVSYYAVKMAEAMGREEDFVERVRVAGLFHDVGKIGISDEILLKNSRLTEEEYGIIKKHSEKGGRILSAISLFGDIAQIVRDHHERIDGRGYPDGMLGPDICEEARIISIADAFDAMTSHRQYRENLSFDDAVGQLVQGSGTQFDAEIVKVFLRVLENYDAMHEELAWTFA